MLKGVKAKLANKQMKLRIGAGLVAASVSASASAEVPAWITAWYTAMTTDVTSLTDLMGPLVALVTTAFVFVKLFKRTANKAT